MLAKWSLFACVVLFSVLSLAAPVKIVSKVVGKVGDYYITSREAIASRILEKELFPDSKLAVIENIRSNDFTMQVTSALLEKVVSVEAETFSVATVSDTEFEAALNTVKKNLVNDKLWLQLKISSVEEQDLIMRKLRSKKFLKYKTDSASLTVTDFEVKEYYEKSRYKFGNLPFESFKENIRQFLIQKQTEDRLKEWFEVLRKKYQVRNLLVEVNG